MSVNTIVITELMFLSCVYLMK